jgi:eukaryotic-like serine/threonine-protein kinase
LAGCGQGKDAAGLTTDERTRWRQQALEWLRADLKYRTQQAASTDKKSRGEAKQSLTYWQTDSDLAGIRDAKELAVLPAAERESWQQFWSEVKAVLQRDP